MEFVKKLVELDKKAGAWNLRQIDRLEEGEGGRRVRVFVGILVLLLALIVAVLAFGMMLSIVLFVPGIMLFMCASLAMVAGLHLIGIKPRQKLQAVEP